MIFSLHSLSFLGLAICVVLLNPLGLGGLLLLALPVHLFVHLRGVYRTGVVMTLLRMGWLLVGTVIGVAFIMAGLLAVGQLAIGLAFGLGQFATGYVAIGQIALGVYALAQIGYGFHVWDTRSSTPLAVSLFRSFLP